MSAANQKNIEDIYSLSPMQQGMLFHTLYAPGSGIYIEQVSCTLRGALNVSLFERAWQQVVDHYPALRTAFAWKDLDAPLQIVRRHVKLPWEQHDWRTQTPSEQQARLAHVLQADRARGFNPAKAPLMRMSLICLAEDTYHFIWTHHHLLLDGWSLPLILRAVFRCYKALSQGHRLSLEPSRPYRDYIEWLQRQPLDQAKVFWQTMLAGFDAPTPLGIDRGASGSRGAPGEYRSAEFLLAATTTAALQSLARSQQLTISTIVQGAWAIVLSRYSGSSDVVFGVTVAGRPTDLAGVETIAGLFINTLPARIAVPPTATLGAWLKDLQRQLFEIRQYEYSPLVQIQGWSAVHRSQPLFESIVVFENYPVNDAVREQIGGIVIGDVQATEQTNYPLTIVAMSGVELGLRVSYDSRRFEDDAITRLLGHLERLLTDIAAGSRSQIGDLRTLPEAERQQLLYGWNATRTAYPAHLCVHQLFAAQVARSPDTLAVLDEQTALSYAALYTRVNQLAQLLHARGVGPEVVVALCLDRSVDLVVALLATLTAGGAYLPIDPTMPPARITTMLATAQPAIVLTHSALCPRLPATSAPQLCLDTLAPELARASTAPPASAVAPNHLAYVLYTSGSTGVPKGVMTTHRALVNRLTWMQSTYPLTAADAVLQKTPIGFDVSLWELLWPLLVGARLVLARPGGHKDPIYLAELIARAQVTTLHFVPSLLRVFLEVAPLARCASLRRVICSGEALGAELAARCQALLAAELHNLYGPTEAAIDVSAWACERGARDVVPIGRPVANTQLYVLDRGLAPVPIGVAGELYIGGEQLARGYVGQPTLTAERFVPNPFGTRNEERGTQNAEPARTTGSSFIIHRSSFGERLYKTGDRARWRADGALEYLGRTDAQVKVRGMRVEPGEVEAVLAQHPTLAGCAVVAHEIGVGELQLVGYVVGVEGEAPSVGALRAYMREQLPEYMVPSALIVLEALPLSSNGKLDRKALPAPDAFRPELPAAYVIPHTRIEQIIADIWQTVLRREKVGIHDNFFDLGGHSILVIRVQSMLRDALKQATSYDYAVSIVDLFEHPTIHALATYLSDQHTLSEQSGPSADRPAHMPGGVAAAQTPDEGAQSGTARPGAADGIAIIGMAGRFPGARDIETFWRNLHDGVESITFFSDEELIEAGIDQAILRSPYYIKATGVLEDADRFDASFFGFTPREAELLDPQHRVFLECAWEALEHAGYDPERYDGLVGVYAGASVSGYLLLNLYPRHDIIESAGEYQVMLSNDKDYLSTRVSYKLNLRGPAVTVQTACSTSLVAVHLACQALRSGECDMALAGGVSVGVPLKKGYLYQEGGITSPDGHCRAFDAHAQGIVGGNGVGVVVLKRLAEALAAGDHIQAVIKGSAINNDGAQRVGYTAPGIAGQAAAITRALAAANVDPETIGYVEAHGTGTNIGDPIEVAALTRAFRARTPRTGFCAIGSVKTNIGHLDAAAGIASVIKTVLALEHRQIPPSLNFEQPNPRIDFASSPLYVNTKLTEWPSNGAPRRAGVSGFGIGGTNAHVIIEEAPVLVPSDPARPWQLLVLSAHTRAALDQMTSNLAVYLGRHQTINLADVAYTLQVGRKALGQRRMLVCRDWDDALVALESGAPERVLTQAQESRNRSVAFLFPGQGVQYAQMGRDLYQAEPVFRMWVDCCAEQLKPHLGLDLRTLLYPAESKIADGGSRMEDRSSAIRDLDQTQYTQPALFVIEYALAQLWMDWGVRPQAMIGHSLGEYVAACLAGVFSLEDALALVAARGRLIQALPAGAMLSIPLPADEVRPLLSVDLGLAAINAPRLCVVSGPREALATLEERLTRRGVETRWLQTSHAFHSAMMDPIIEPFQALVQQIPLHPPTIPYCSNLTGTWITAADATDPSYWARQLRQTVRFSDGATELLDDLGRVLLEVGPGRTLGACVQQIEPGAPRVALPSLPRPHDQQSGLALMLTALGRLWLAGIAVHWAGNYGHERRARIPLPTYPFERQRHWVEARPAQRAALPLDSAIHKKPAVADWLYIPIWKQSMRLPAAVLPQLLTEGSVRAGCWLIFCDESALGAALISRLAQAGQDVICVYAGERFHQLGPGTYTLNPRQRADYDALVGALRTLTKTPHTVVHLWTITADQPLDSSAHRTAAQDRGFYSLVFLAQALRGGYLSDRFRIVVVSNNLYEVIGGDLYEPERALVLGPCKVIPQEYPNMICQHIDLALTEAHTWHTPALVEQILAECAAQPVDPVVAYRKRSRWVQTVDAIPQEALAHGQPRLREGGVYMITGGLGSIGLALAEYLTQRVRAKLVLVGRTHFPPREAWPGWLEQHSEEDAISRKIRHVQALEQLGAEVLTQRADVADPAQMQAVVEQTYERFGALHGVLHAAGLVGEKAIQLIQEIDRSHSEAQFHAKVDGTLVLEQVLAGHELDFCMLFSSLSSVLGGLGLAAYAAANAFMDAFAWQQQQRGSFAWLSVNWDAWQPREEHGQRQNIGGMLSELTIAPDEGVAAFERIISLGSPEQVIVSTGDLNARIATWLTPRTSSEFIANETLSLRTRPALVNEYIAPTTEIEQRIAVIWQELLGIEPIGRHDSFFELGGHSLLATQAMSRLRDAFQMDISLRHLLESPTVAGLASEIARRSGQQSDTYSRITRKTDQEAKEQLLANLDQLSDAEVAVLLNTMLAQGETRHDQ